MAFNIIKAHPNISGFDEETFFFCRRRFDDFNVSSISDLEMDTLIRVASDKIALFDSIACAHKKKIGAAFFAEKTPEHALFLRQMLYWFPRSKFLFLVRDGRDCFASVKRNPVVWANHGQTYPYVWRDTARAFLRVAPHENLMALRYEMLVKEPCVAMARAMRFLGLELKDCQLDPRYYGTSNFSSQTGHTRLQMMVSDKTVGKWKEDLTRCELDLFANVCAAPMRKLGYTM